jgi:hypothetical protein
MAAALVQARASEEWSIIQVILDRNDHSPALHRLTTTLKERVARSKG